MGFVGVIVWLGLALLIAFSARRCGYSFGLTLFCRSCTFRRAGKHYALRDGWSANPSQRWCNRKVKPSESLTTGLPPYAIVPSGLV
jgi:hypothetical protein